MWLWVVCGAAALLLVGWGALSSNYSYRYRLMVEVETPQGLRTGSAVHETLVSKSNINLGDLNPKRELRTRGEAVAVDLPNGRTLFVLVPDTSLTQAVLDPGWKNDWVESAKRIIAGDTPQGRLPMILRKSEDLLINPIRLPMLVRFRDIEDPKSAEQVNPNDLVASFGIGVRLRRIDLQLTVEKVSTGIEERLKWLREYRGKLLSGSKFPTLQDRHEKGISAVLSGSSFLRK